MSSSATSSASKGSSPSSIKFLNPLLDSLIPYQQWRNSMPKTGRTINATFTRDRKIVEECIRRCSENINNSENNNSENISSSSSLSTKEEEVQKEKFTSALDSGIIVVYQNFNKEIVDHATKYQTFLGNEKYYNPTRMTWIKTSYLWCVFRGEWNTRDVNQARMCAITLPISAFDELLKLSVRDVEKDDLEAVPAKFRGEVKLSMKQEKEQDEKEESSNKKNESEKVEQEKIENGNENNNSSTSSTSATTKKTNTMSRSDAVRIQFDPEHGLSGTKINDGRREIQMGLRSKALEIFHRSILCIDDITETIVAPNRPLKFKKIAESEQKFRLVGNTGSIPGGEKQSKKLKQQQQQQQQEKEKTEEKSQEKEEDSTATSSSSSVVENEEQNILVPFESLYFPLEVSTCLHVGLSPPEKTAKN